MSAQPPIAIDPGSRLRGLLALPIPVTVQGVDLRLVDANEAYAALVGRTRAALVGRDPVDLLPPEEREGARALR
ncbi:MAG: PAS domain-containing protein, partial [Burkholderiales bacterium]|nr:PAS domain-containing protein [Burkholderiales bacterium]